MTPARPAQMDDLWRKAGGGTPLFSPARFALLLETAPEIAAPKTCGDCAGRAPHSCWFAAVGAVVVASRKRKPARPVPGQMPLFDEAEAVNPAPLTHVPANPARGRTAKHMPQAGTSQLPERTR